MSNKESKVKLFPEFPPVNTSEWKQKLEKDLKGSSTEKLVWKTLDGIDLQPFYRDEDLADKTWLRTIPAELGTTPFPNNWDIRQDILVNNIEISNTTALHALDRGATSIGFVIPETLSLNEKSFSNLLKGISIDCIHLNFITHTQAGNILDLLEKEVKKQKIDPDRINGFIDLDPLGYLSSKGNFKLPEKQEFMLASEIIKKASGKFPHLKVIGINTNIFHNAGASTVQELGLGLSMIAEYLQQFTGMGISPGLVAKAMQINMATGPAYFIEIAKIRTARWLIAKLVNSWSETDETAPGTYIHSSTSEWAQTTCDPYTNILRSTTQSMSAVLGGTNSLTVIPFDKSFRKTTPFSERIARNTQIILKEEAYFDKVKDPSSGSYYIETITDSLTKHAWDLFLHIEDEGGYLKAFKSGSIQKIIKETAAKRDMNIALRKDIFVGINKYQNPDEKVQDDFDPGIAFPPKNPDDSLIAEPLIKYRGAGAFEELKMITEKNKSGIPNVFLLQYGNQTWRKARAEFASGFFGCGGFNITGDQGFDTIDVGIEAAKNAKADIIVLCSSDDEYAVIAPEVFEKIPDTIILVIAGYPKDSVEELKSKGILNYIHLKSNVLEELRKYQKMVGI